MYNWIWNMIAVCRMQCCMHEFAWVICRISQHSFSLPKTRWLNKVLHQSNTAYIHLFVLYTYFQLFSTMCKNMHIAYLQIISKSQVGENWHSSIAYVSEHMFSYDIMQNIWCSCRKCIQLHSISTSYWYGNTFYKDRSINKLQNHIILLIFKM